MEYRNNSQHIINETKRILEKSYEQYHKKNLTYYDDVLKFLNLIFNEQEKSIMKLKLRKITFTHDIFNLYNNIIKQYKLNKDLFDVDNFDVEDFHDFSNIVEITKIMSNNLLNKLNYKLDMITYANSKKRFKISILNNGF